MESGCCHRQCGDVIFLGITNISIFAVPFQKIFKLVKQ